MKPQWSVCIGTPIADGKQAFTQVGVGWDTKSGGGINFKVNVRVLLGPEDQLYLFRADRKGKATETLLPHREEQHGHEDDSF